MDVKLAVLADAANVSREGKLNILGVFNVIYAASFPALHPPMYLVLNFEANNVEAGKTKTIEIVFQDEDGVKLGSITGSCVVPKGEAGYPIQINHVQRIPSTPFQKPGDYEFKILINEDPKETISLRVVPMKSGTGEGKSK